MERIRGIIYRIITYKGKGTIKECQENQISRFNPNGNIEEINKEKKTCRDENIRLEKPFYIRKINISYDINGRLKKLKEPVFGARIRSILNRIGQVERVTYKGTATVKE